MWYGRVAVDELVPGLVLSEFLDLIALYYCLTGLHAQCYPVEM
jgi:hypothetical protein